MFGCFPTPYPDELLYSVLARLRERLQFPSGKTFLHELFGTTNVIPVVDLPGHINALLEHLPSGHGYTSDQIIDELTLLPYYAPFLPPDRLARIRTDMKSARGSSIHMRIGVMASSIRKIEYLRLCSRCQEEDRMQWGESYWHRSHQLPGVLVCPIHQIGLLQTAVRCSNARTRHVYVTAHEVGEVTTLILPFRAITDELLARRIASDSARLLQGKTEVFRPEQLRLAYQSLLYKHGYMTKTKRLRASALLTAFQSYYSDDLLTAWGCTLHTQKYDPWLFRIARDIDNTHHTLKHLLLLNFLGTSVDGFFDSLKEEGGWDNNQSHSGSLSFCSTYSPLPSTIEVYRIEWQQLRVQYPEYGVNELRHKANGLYTKLYRYDRQWLTLHKPLSKSRVQECIRVDWKARDQELASRIFTVSESIRKSNNPMQRITKTEIGKRLGAAAILQQHIDKLPDTATTIAEVVETREAYAIRRIQWTVEQFQLEGVTAKRWEIIRRSGVERLVKCGDVKKILDQATLLTTRGEMV